MNQTSRTKTLFFYLLSCVIFIHGIAIFDAHSQANDISLVQSFSQERLQKILIPQKEWSPFPNIGQREQWDRIPKAIRDVIIEGAEKAASEEISVLPASVYLQFKRNGNRSNYQNLWYDRRVKLHSLVLAECIENKGRFLDPIADMVWAICEETSWTWPAHIGLQKAGVDLPDADDQVVALFSAQTANTFALTEYLIGDRLDEVSPLIHKRMLDELDRRILTPFMEKRFGWMGYGDRANKSYPNNWNPWICSNVLLTALIAEDDETRRAEIVHKGLDCLDNFLTYYPFDGSCDEGPSYWGRAGASLLDALEHLYSASNQKIDFYSHPLIQEIGRFIYRAHIVDNYFICLGDCDARAGLSNELVFRYGKRIGDEKLMAMGAYGVDEESLTGQFDRVGDLNRALYLLFDGRELIDYNPPSPPLVRDVWLGHPDMQLMAARDSAGTAEGLFVAAWGGHNAQSHNHNDVGNVVVFADGKPMLIDIGRPTYTRQTFSSHRYEIWAFQSGYHNLPTINGKDQPAGRRYAAKGVSYDSNDERAKATMDISKAYPNDSGALSWTREVQLERGKAVLIKDAYELEEPSSDLIENFICAGKPVSIAPGKLSLNDRDESVKLLMQYDPDQLTAEIETIELEDGKLRSVWGERIYRIRLKVNAAKKADGLGFRISKMD